MNILTDNEEIIKIIETLFQSGITKDLSKLKEMAEKAYDEVEVIASE